MKLSFESDLQFQQDAIQSITALFEGQPLEEAIQEFDLGEKERRGASGHEVTEELKNLSEAEEEG